jgi:hypothetical protein
MRSPTCHLLGVRTPGPQEAKFTVLSVPFVGQTYMAEPVINAALLEEKRVTRTRGVKAQD